MRSGSAQPAKAEVPATDPAPPSNPSSAPSKAAFEGARGAAGERDKAKPVSLQGGMRAPVASSVAPRAQIPDWIQNFDVDRAEHVLGPQLGTTSDPAALRTMLVAYANFLAAHPEEVNNPHMYFVDYGLDNATPRGWVINMKTLRLDEGPFNVAAGAGSGPRDGVPTRFANASWPDAGEGSFATALGLYTTAASTYEFHGKADGVAYESVGLRLKGWSAGFNDNAWLRRLVLHGAPYVTAVDAGRSAGCAAMQQARAERLLTLLAGGAVAFFYSPNDPTWFAGDQWVNGKR